jgi:hypothetical protein
VSADVLLSEAREIAQMAEALVGAEHETLRTTASERLALYETERKAVLDAHAVGPEAARAVVVGSRANLIFARYRRHFAGQDRRSRDLGLLDELISDSEELQRISAELVVAKAPEGLRKDLEIITENLALYRRERGSVDEGRRSGTAEERASLLAKLANHQFQLYALHFAGQPRMSRRQGLLERILGELDDIGEAMVALSAEGLGGEDTKKNASIVSERRSVYGDELRQLRGVQAQATVFQLLRALEQDAEAILADYDRDFAGHDRASRDPAQLSLLCDRMGEIERQFAALGARFNLGVRHRPTARVRDLAVMFEREHAAVLKARLN